MGLDDQSPDVTCDLSVGHLGHVSMDTVDAEGQGRTPHTRTGVVVPSRTRGHEDPRGRTVDRRDVVVGYTFVIQGWGFLEDV